MCVVLADDGVRRARAGAMQCTQQLLKCAVVCVAALCWDKLLLEALSECGGAVVSGERCVSRLDADESVAGCEEESVERPSMQSL